MLLFHGLNFINLNIDSKDEANQELLKQIYFLIEYYGGKLTNSLSIIDSISESTVCTSLHAICSPSKDLDLDLCEQIEKAFSNNQKIKIITPNWIIDCIEHSKLIDELNYHPKYSLSLQSNKDHLIELKEKEQQQQQLLIIQTEQQENQDKGKEVMVNNSDKKVIADIIITNEEEENEALDNLKEPLSSSSPPSTELNEEKKQKFELEMDEIFQSVLAANESSSKSNMSSACNSIAGPNSVAAQINSPLNESEFEEKKQQQQQTTTKDLLNKASVTATKTTTTTTTTTTNVTTRNQIEKETHNQLNSICFDIIKPLQQLANNNNAFSSQGTDLNNDEILKLAKWNNSLGKYMIHTILTLNTYLCISDV